MYVRDNEAVHVMQIVDERTGIVKRTLVVDLQEEFTEPELAEHEALICAPTWTNLTETWGKFYDFAAWHSDQNTMQNVFMGLVKQPQPAELGAKYSKEKLGFGEMTDKQMHAQIKLSCAMCGAQEKAGRKPVVIKPYHAGLYCTACAEILADDLGAVATVSRYTRAGYMQHASEKGNQAVLFTDGQMYTYHKTQKDKQYSTHSVYHLEPVDTNQTTADAA